ncbi:MAG: T9SS type A sorting domain-containing protein [Sphingobacteriaceae bacterium]|nr:T9SS type A sorting domain-containing protein [Sphingobacteriaceae bacterium]
MNQTITQPRGVSRASKSLFKFLLIILFLSLNASVFAQKQVERLGRGVVAVRTSASQVYVGWRLLGTDPSSIAFNVYRGTTKLNATPITASTNYVDNVTTNSTYTVRPVISGVEQAASTGATVWGQIFLEVGLQVPPPGRTPPYEVTVGGVVESYPNGQDYTYAPNDCSPGDVDGDGEYEIIVLWNPSNARDNSQAGWTGNVYIDAYKQNGTRLWRIDLGRNIRAGGHYTQLMVYDLDGDGKAEVAVKTADGTRSGTGQLIGNGSVDYRNSEGRIITGPEFLTIFNGQTGAAMATTDFVPGRGTVCDWGDCHGNRVDRFVSTIAYVDGTRPSLIIGRGYYTRLVRSAWDWRNGTLTRKWTFDSNTTGNSTYAGEGNHQLSVADGNGDGRHDIYNGSSTVSGTGAGLYSNGLGHGDALHVSDMNPDRPGQEVWMCHEEAGSNGGIGLSLTDGRTGARIWSVPGTGDVGRGVAADIDPRYKGFECWGATGGLYTVTGTQITATKPTMNHLLWWDGDVQREILDGTKLDKWDPAINGVGRLISFYNYGTAGQINGSKANPNFSADILGDWREEVVFKSADNTKLLIFTTTIPAANRFYTFMHDPQYRCQVAGQVSAYNQPPHTSFYFGGGMAAIPVPNIYLAGTAPGSSITIQENTTGFCSTAGTIDNNNAGFTGTGFINTNNAVGAGAVWRINAPAAGAYTLTWRHSNGSGANRPARLLVNGTQMVSNIDFNATTDFTTWVEVSINVNLAAGQNTIRLEATTATGLSNIDYLKVTGNAPTVLSCSGVTMAVNEGTLLLGELNAAVENNTLKVYPNPSSNVFNLSVAGKFTYNIADQLGKVIEKGEGENEVKAGSNLAPGVYFITVKNGLKIETFKVIKQ